MTTSEKARLISVIICNYNYERFVGETIRSALDARWPNKEIIVVDDGSTDGSWEVITSFESRGVVAVWQENQGQLTALQHGYALSKGELVIFLDSDDLVAPSLFEEANLVYRPGVSKIQVRMAVIDEHGATKGPDYPRFPQNISPEKIRTWVTNTTAYPTPPASGNLYARWFLDRILPIENPNDRFLDSYCLAAAPHLGDVETIDKPLVSYRVHGANAGAMTKLDPEKLQLGIRRAIWRADFARARCIEAGLNVPADPLQKSIPVLMMRATSLRLQPDLHPIPYDSRWKVARDFVGALQVESAFAPRVAAAMFAWTLGILAAPKPMAEQLASWRYAPATRPAMLRRLLAR